MRIFIIVVILLPHLLFAQNTFPKNSWKQFTNPKDAGFSMAKLEELKERFNEFGGDALLIIRDGKVVLSLGETSRNFRQHSIRKSYVNSLFGIYSYKGIIDLNEDLNSLGINDIHPLSDTEKKATILNLLQSRSGIFLPAAYSPQSMIDRMPKRGSAKTGEIWVYNNWDFNVLASIFNKKTNKDLFKVFYNEIAKPLQFEDFTIYNTKYFYEPSKSEHPAYLLRMSARDMARFGLLYLNNGVWKNKQIFAKEWVQKSFTTYSHNGLDKNSVFWDDYGLLWWISTQFPNVIRP